MRLRLFAIGVALVLSACSGPAPAQAPSTAATQNTATKPPTSASPVAAASPAAAASPSAAASPAAASSPPAANGAASGPLSHIRISYPNVDMGHLHLWVAEDEGMFAKNGLDVSDQLVSNSSATIAALLSGQIDIAQTGGSDAISAAANGADVVVVAVEIPVYTYLLEVPGNVTTVEQLKGAKIGIDSFGSSPDIAVRVALRQAGLDPDKDVSIVPVGNVPTRAAALMQGAIQGTVINPPSSLLVEDAGFHPLINLAQLKLPAVSQTTIAMRPWVASHRAEMQKYVDTLIEAGQWMRQNKAETVKIMSKYLKNDDERQMSYTYDFYVGQVYPNAPFPKPEMFKDSIDLLGKSNPKVEGFDASKILDPSFVQNAVDRGLVKP